MIEYLERLVNYSSVKPRLSRDINFNNMVGSMTRAKNAAIDLKRVVSKSHAKTTVV